MAAAKKVTVYVHAHVRDEDGSIIETVVLAPGDTVPKGADLGPHCFAKPEGDDDAEDGDSGDQKPTTVEGIVAAVGEDKALAQQYLDEENAAAKPRSTLVEQLQAVIAAGA